MIIQSKEAQAKTSLIDLLGGNTKSSTTKSNDLFSKLLAKLSTTLQQQSSDFKAIIDPKAVIDSKGVTIKTVASTTSVNTKSSQIQELQTLLLGNDEKDSTLFSKELINTLSNDQVRTLINRAKEYLKNEITAKSPEYQNDNKALPKTLMGLVKLAEKMGLDPQSISLSNIINDSTEQNKKSTIYTPEVLTKPLFEAKVLTQVINTPLEPASFVSISQLISDVKTKEQKVNTTSEMEVSPMPNSEGTELSTAKEHSSPLALFKDSAEKLETQPLQALLQHLDKHEASLSSPEPDTKIEIKSAEIKTPQTKVSTVIPAKADTLLMLLQGDNEPKESKIDRAHASKTEEESPKAMAAPKADSLEVKSKEASQSMRSFASDLKEAVQEYKPPFTRLTMKLNPEKLGEVEVTLVQRGNNVHVNIQSNNTNSVAFLAHNATELKTQLANQGITNATMSFMSGGDGQTQSQGQQQQQNQQQQNRFRAYESLKDIELNGEQLSALEIIIPHYA